jgi:hypothetical protein
MPWESIPRAANKLIERYHMPSQKKTPKIQKYKQLSLWKRMTLVTTILFSGGSFATLVPSQAAYAHSNRSNTSHHTGHKGRKESIKLLVVCKAGNGGKGGSATRKSNGAAGGAGGNCIINVPISLTIQNNKHQKISTSSPETNHNRGQRSDN